MKLKTLKDIGFFTEVRNVPNVFKKSKIEAVFKDELKAEAIKWVKEMLMDIEKTEKGIPNDLDILKKKYAIPQQIHAIACMKHFFNITEEDLR